MRILFYCFGNAEVGLGHYYRTLTLAKEAIRRGHEILWAGDRRPPGISFMAAKMGSGNHFETTAAAVHPDWVVADLQGDVPEWVFAHSGKTCLIDGIGQPGGKQADLVINHAFKGDFCAPDYLLLRPELAHCHRAHVAPCWFVFGGGADKMRLAERFARAMPYPAFLMTTPYTPPFAVRYENQWACRGGDAMGRFAARCTKACVAMGMTVWELVYLRIPTCVFSISSGHLETALEMNRRGLVKAYPDVGLPDDEVLVDFLTAPFAPDFESTALPDLKGAQRTLERMEELLCSR